MEILLEHLLGPLAAIECRRSLRRGWVLIIRWAAVVPPALVALAVLWLWWFGQRLTPGYSPSGALVVGTAIVEAMFVTVALLLGQAMLGGSLAGEKVRSMLELLLASSVSAPEIIVGRLAGRLCIVAAVLAAGVPILVGFAALTGLGPLALATLVALPAAVAFGGGGLALAVSAVARRGRDALLVVYLVEFLLLLTPLFGSALPVDLGPWVEPLNPYHGIGPLVAAQDSGPALATIGWWVALGVAGCAWAGWRLRPACLGATEQGVGRPLHSWRLPRLGDRPMLWKELYVEQVHAFSRLVRWLGIAVVALFAGWSLALAGLVAWSDPIWSNWALMQLTDLLGWSWLICWLSQWAIGLRAAAAIASERQRGTWDLLLTSPLEGAEIVRAKMYGSVYVLRGFFAAVLLAWVAGLLCEALAPSTFIELLAQTLVIGGFMLAFGMAFSLHCGSPTRAMTLTIVCWLAAGFGLAVLAGILTLMVLFVAFVAWLVWTGLQGGGFPAGPGPAAWPALVYQVLRLGLYSAAAIGAVAYILHRFDSLAGRCSAVAEIPARPRRLPAPKKGVAIPP